MIRRVRIAIIVMASLLSSTVFAGNGTFSVSPHGVWSGYEYCSTCGTPATISGGGVLSDGKVIENIGEPSVWRGTWFFDVSGFTSDPGATYIDHLFVTCDAYPWFRTLTVSNYWGYGSGWAFWELYDPDQWLYGACWTSSSSKNVVVVD